MENTLDTFKARQEQTLQLLEKLQRFLCDGTEVGVPVDPVLSNKLLTAINSVSAEKLKVALIGGFSEGKTSIAAAWMERLDKSTMRISHQESSNEVKVYEVDNEFVLIDTPGLFGFKEQENPETHAIEKYKEITRKYVSEAHLVLYVMNSTNPVKQSHQEDLVWLFRTLDLLPRTVFVLSRFDEVADVEDEQDYQANFQIKRNNVTDRLHELIQLSEQEVNDLSIVAVAANPFDLGVEHWLENIDQFKAVSHIAALQSATTEKIQKNGGSDALVSEMRTSVIRDLLNSQLPVAIENDEKISQEVDRLTDLNDRLATQLASTGEKIDDARVRLREFAMRYFSNLILQAKGCSLETFADFFENEVGEGGIILSTKLQNEFSRQTQSINFEMEKMQVSFDNEVNHFNTAVRALGKQGINHVLKGNLINNSTILAARDGITSIAKTVGMDVGKYLKFKPWGAVKFAKGASGALAVLGVALEVWDSWEQQKREDAFRKSIDEMVGNFEQQRQDFLDLVNAEGFKEAFFPDYLHLKNCRQELQENLDENLKRQQRFHAWRVEAEEIKAEFLAIQ